MGKKGNEQVAAFKKKLRNLEPGKELIYHEGELAYDREESETVNQIASLALAVDEIGAGCAFQRRLPDKRGFQYVVRVFRRLGMRKDDNGTFQEVLRVARLQEGRIKRGVSFA